MKDRLRSLLFVLWAIAFGFGVVGVYQRLVYGHALAGYGSYVVWGLWVAGYIYLVGLSAGSFLFAAVVHVLNIKRLEEIGRLAVLTSVVTMGVALLAVWFDLGHMTRFYRVFTSPQWGSMMTWMIWMYTAYGVLLACTAYYMVKKNEAMVRFLFTLGIPLAIAFPGGGGALFATLSARPFWHNPMYPVFFIIGAIISGTALIAALAGAWWPRRDAAHGEMMHVLGRVVMALIALELLLEWAEFSIPMWYGINPEKDVMLQILLGKFWWVFWVVHIGMGSVLPLVMLYRHPQSTRTIGWSAALVAVTFLAVRLNIVIPGQVTPELKGLMSAFTDSRLTFAYSPTSHEWLVMVFLAAVGIAAFWVGARILPIAPPAADTGARGGKGVSAA